MQLGDLCPFNEITIPVRPPDLDRPWVFKFTYGDNLFPYTLSVAYRGCDAHYEYPLRASAFRRFNNAADAESYDKLKGFAANLASLSLSGPSIGSPFIRLKRNLSFPALQALAVDIHDGIYLTTPISRKLLRLPLAVRRGQDPDPLH